MRLVAAIASEAIDADRKPDIKGDLARADILATSGRLLESLTETLKVYLSSAGLFGNALSKK